MFDINLPAGLPVIIAVLALQGCGHKGPLVLPASRVPTATVPASPPVADPQKPSPPASLPDKQP
jgi:predicted small lipoprotein YifL